MSRWPFAVLLELAAADEAAARDGLALALGQEEARQREHDAAHQALETHRAAEARGHRPPPRAGAAASLRAAAAHAARVRADGSRLLRVLCGCQAALGDAGAEVEACREALAAAHAAVRALEAHRDAWRTAQRRRRERAEEAALEDLVSGRRRAAS